MMFNAQIFIACMLIFWMVSAIASEDCTQIERQRSLLTSGDHAKLDSEGFAYMADVSRALPSVVISQKIIASCRNRYIAERYFQNKIDGRNQYPVSRDEIAAARSDIAKAVYYALKAQDVWEDGVGHEIFNTVSDELLPDWIQWQREQLRQGYITEEYFTNWMFLNPDPSLLPVLNEVLKTTTSLPQIALIYFLKKNLGEKLDLRLAKRDLNRGLIEEGNIGKLTATARAIKILSKSGKVTWDEARQYSSEIYGWD